MCAREVFVYVYMCVCMYMCACMCERVSMCILCLKWKKVVKLVDHELCLIIKIVFSKEEDIIDIIYDLNKFAMK